MSMTRQAQIGTNLTLDLPLDEDDYLMPQPPQPIATISSGNQAYMDILDDSKLPGKCHISIYLQNCFILYSSSPQHFLTSSFLVAQIM